MKDKYLILLCFILIGILYYRQQTINCIEKMTNDDITTNIINQYNNDLLSMQTISNMASQIKSTGGITINGDLNLAGKLLIGSSNPYTFDGTSNLNISNKTSSYTFNIDGTNSIIPSGLIISWGNNNIPFGWVICDGTNSTPNLSGNFILGANSNRKLGTIGGTNTPLLLTPNTIPQHSHSLSYISDGYTYSLMDPTVITTFNQVLGAPEGSENGGVGQNNTAMQINSYTPLLPEPVILDSSPIQRKKISDVFNLGGLTANAMKTNTQVPINLIPSYYVLIYIMKK